MTFVREGVLYDDTGAMVVTLGSGATIPNPTFTGVGKFDDGAEGAPSITFTANATWGLWRSTNFGVVTSINGTGIVGIGGVGPVLKPDAGIQWNSVSFSGGLSRDLYMSRAGANSIQFSATSHTAGAATSRTELNKATTSIANAVATSVVTFTIPNAAHSASARVKVVGSLGAGGAIGANEASACNVYDVTITRTAGVNAVAAISAAYGAAASAVAGAATVTCTAALSAVSGAVGATNTVDVQVTISRSAGSSTNHTCFTYVELLNANVTGVTVA